MSFIFLVRIIIDVAIFMLVRRWERCKAYSQIYKKVFYVCLTWELNNTKIIKEEFLMKTKWFVAIPAITLMVAAFPLQPADAASKSESVQLSESDSDIPAGYEAILNWPAEEQPIVKQGSQSFEVEFIQVMLNHFGFKVEIDGVFGAHTDEQVRQLQAEQGLTQDGIVGVHTWIVLLEAYQSELFPVEKAIAYAEESLDNDDLVFSSDGVIHKDEGGKIFYSLKAQSQDLIDNGGTGTVGFYDVYQNGDVIESKPR